MPLLLNKRQLQELIDAIEQGGGDATLLRRELEALGPEPRPRARRAGPRDRREEDEMTLSDRLNYRVGGLFGGAVTDDLVAKLIDLDRQYNLKELRTMCREAGIGTGGDKKELAAKLVAERIL